MRSELNPNLTPSLHVCYSDPLDKGKYERRMRQRSRVQGLKEKTKILRIEEEGGLFFEMSKTKSTVLGTIGMGLHEK